MRGDDQQQNHMFSYLSPEMRVRKDHPRRAIRAMVDEVLTQLPGRFDTSIFRSRSLLKDIAAVSLIATSNGRSFIPSAKSQHVGSAPLGKPSKTSWASLRTRSDLVWRIYVAAVLYRSKSTPMSSDAPLALTYCAFPIVPGPFGPIS
jgi:hypothetical protein